jgi:hypothetical protein
MVFFTLLIPVAVLAGGAQGGFDGVVRSIESRYHVRATRIPFMGLISLISRKATHGGVSGLHVAEFDSFTAPVDGDELDRMVEEKLGQGWERVIRETSRETRHPAGNETGRKPDSAAADAGASGGKGGQQTLIFMRPEGDRMGLFVVDLDGNEMDVVQVSVDPRHLDDDIGHYSHSHHHDKDDAEQSD